MAHTVIKTGTRVIVLRSGFEGVVMELDYARKRYRVWQDHDSSEDWYTRDEIDTKEPQR